LRSIFEVFPFASDFNILFFSFFFSFFSFRNRFFSFFFSFLSFVGSILHSEWLFRLFFLSLEDSEEEDDEEDDVDEDEDDLLCLLDICLISSLELLKTGFSFFSFLCFFDFLEDPDLLLDSLLLLIEPESLLLLDADSPLLLRFFDMDSPLLLLDDLDLLLPLGLLDLFREDRDLLLLLRLGLGMA